MTTAAPTTGPMPPRRSRRRLNAIERRNIVRGLFFISPWLIGFIFLTIYPIIYTLYLSFTRYSGFGTPTFIGGANYSRLTTDPLFWKSAYNTLYYTLLAVPIGVVVAMALALAMNTRVREVSVYRAAFYLPSILPVFALTFIFILVLNPGYGLLNFALSTLGLPSPDWLGDPAYTKIGLVLLAQMGAGQFALIFLAALRGIPTELYESAALDGAGPINRIPPRHPPDDDPRDPLRPGHRAQPRAPGLHAAVHHDWRRRDGSRAGQLAPHLRVLSLQERLPAQPDGVRSRALHRAFRCKPPARRHRLPMGRALGVLRGPVTARTEATTEAVTGATARVQPDVRPVAPRRRLSRVFTRSILPRVVLVGGAILFLAPLYWMLLSALKTNRELATFPPSLIPHSWVWSNFIDAINFIPFALYAFNSSIITLGVTIGAVFSNTLVAYGFSRIRWPGRDALFYVCMATLFLPFPVLIVGLFDIFAGLGWVDSYLPIIVPAFFANPFYIFLMRQFMLTIPRELSDAARVDGASELQTFWRVDPAADASSGRGGRDLCSGRGLERIPPTAALPPERGEVHAGHRTCVLQVDA